MTKDKNKMLRFLIKNHNFKTKNYDVIEDGKYLESISTDDLINGGFWIWEIGSDKEFYSKKFRNSLKYKDENEFPNLATSWMSCIIKKDLEISLSNYNKSIETLGNHEYTQVVTYICKDNSKIQLECSAVIIKNDKNVPIIMVGTHNIL